VVAFSFIVLVPMMYSLLPESVNALISRGRLDEARAVADRYGVDFEAGLREHAAYGACRAGRGYALAWISRICRWWCVLIRESAYPARHSGIS
jgi:AAHS family benzoate transporter-like MFS transporter